MKPKPSLSKRMLALSAGKKMTVQTHRERVNAHQIALRYGLSIKTGAVLGGEGFEILRIS